MAERPRRERATPARNARATGAALDARFMRMALRLAERGRGHTRPNPVVGAVLVRGARVLSTGYHRRAGEPHAEVEALAKVGFRAPGATLYVTLEPCCHHGRTGPCTVPVITSGVRRVVVGARDPNPRVDGRGVRALRRAGVRVDVGCLEAECRRANRGFFQWIAEGRPHVTMKVATSLDGVIAPRRRAGEAPGVRWLTGSAARRRAHELRAAHDAILVGAETVAADDPALTVRLPGHAAPQPIRIVVDGRLRTPPDARVVRGGSDAPTWILTCEARGLPANERPRHARRARALSRAGARILTLPARRGIIAPRTILRALGAEGIQSLLVEGGASLHGQLIGARLVDAVAVFVAPRLQGDGVRATSGPALPWQQPLALGPLRAEALGADLLLAGEVLRDRPEGRRRGAPRRPRIARVKKAAS
jgi:diaminohydroxyphosphoribosylaminopyrimidine deaminase/5-amino-6-(5-phosphoribosylamino)uracil reductase